MLYNHVVRGFVIVVRVAIRVVAVGIGVGVVVAIWNKNRKNKCGDKENGTDQCVQIDNTRQKAAQEFTGHAHLFSGLYEPVLMIKENRLRRKSGIFDDWNVRINNLSESDTLIAYWNEHFSGFETWSDEEYVIKSSELLLFLSDCGVVRSVDTEVTVELGTYKYYVTKDGEPIEAGVQAKVETPYWSISSDVLEKGVIDSKV